MDDPYKETNEVLKNIYVSLSRAIEDGSELKLGIVIGQVLSKIETLINE
jgi:hypothetical protein